MLRVGLIQVRKTKAIRSIKIRLMHKQILIPIILTPLNHTIQHKTLNLNKDHKNKNPKERIFLIEINQNRMISMQYSILMRDKIIKIVNRLINRIS